MSRGQFSYGTVPTVRISRSAQDLSSDIQTTTSLGRLIPIKVLECIPGDTIKSDINLVVRTSSSLVKPIFGNLFLDVFAFFVPFRLCYNKWEDVMGNNSTNAWAPTTVTSVPTVSSGTVSSLTVADYLGLPVGGVPAGISVMPFRGFARIYNDWFRDEKVIAPINIQEGALNTTYEKYNNTAWGANNYFGLCPNVAKFHDRFTSVLPAPQRGTAPEVNTPVLTAPTDIITTSDMPSLTATLRGYTAGISTGNYPLIFRSGTGGFGQVGTWTPASSGANNSSFIPTNLYTSTTPNQLRTAFQIQKTLERMAMYGGRYTSVLQGIYGVTPGDARLQRAEFLGGKRIPLSIQNVTSTNGATGGDIAGVAGMSWSNGNFKFSKGIVEHGYIYVVACCRQYHNYAQGINRMFFKKNRDEFYSPIYANLGAMPLYTSELYSPGTSGTLDGNIFGYTEAWSEYRSCPNVVTGQMRAGVTGSQADWSIQDVYANAPTLSKTFIEEAPTYLDNALTVPSSTQDQFVINGFDKCIGYRPMPTYSMPGLIDHH